MVAPEQWGSHTVMVSHASQRQIRAPEDLESVLPKGYAFVGEGADQLTIVLGDVWNFSEDDTMAEWFAAIFPQLENPDEVAEAMRDWDCEDAVMASFPGQAWNLFRLQIAIPMPDRDGSIEEWAYGNVVALGRALMVFWFRDREDLRDAAACIDAKARRGRYTGEPPSASVDDLASAYAVETVRAIGECASEGIKEVEEWEANLFDTDTDDDWMDKESGLARLAGLRQAAFLLRQGVDGISRQVHNGQFRASWSTERLESISDRVDVELELARIEVSRFRSNVADAFEAANTLAIVRQLAASQNRQERADRLEGTVTRLTAFLLVPALIAAVFGANVELPGSGWTRTAIMVAAMTGGAVATFAVLRRWDRRS